MNTKDICATALCFAELAIASSASAKSTDTGALVTQAPPGKWTIVMHGGAGVIAHFSMTGECDKAYRAGLEESIQAAAKVLDSDGSAVDAVEAALRLMENNPLFNTGKGADFTADGKNQLDAAIIDGKTMEAGAGVGVMRTKNPISLAKAAMRKSPFVLLSDAGADELAASVGLQ